MHFLWTKNSETLISKLTIVIGSGLIGSAIIERLKSGSREPVHCKGFSIPWSNRLTLLHHLSLIKEEMAIQISHAQTIETVWSAGKAGFNCTKQEADRELACFDIFLSWLVQLQKDNQTKLNVNLVSSLGGLFEGADTQRVQIHTRPNPIRIYGHMKLAQEHKLMSSNDDLGKRIYRVSSAYGPIVTAHRMGLIPTLINNAINQRTTHLTGHLDTRRDYVWAADVAGFLVGNLYDKNNLGTVRSLASFSSFSINEIKDKIETLLNQPLLLTHHASPDNTKSIVICPSLKPASYQTSLIDNNISSIFRNAASSAQLI